MKIALIGSGYVGLVSGACFAEIGHEVICADIDSNKINLLNNDHIPFYEPGLEEIVRRNLHSKRLRFTSDVDEAIEQSLFIFIAVGTPSDEDGSADLKHVLGVAKHIGEKMNDYKVIVNKSTVPVGTASMVEKEISSCLIHRNLPNLEFDVVSNPEFLKEGDAVADFMKPDRIVIGTHNERANNLMKELYEPFLRNGHPLVAMDVRSSELTKYAANAMLASRISFMNEMSLLCEKMGGNIESIRQGIGKDSRIGMQFLYAGIGYGGSCFPKDVKALVQTFRENNLKSHLIESIETVNKEQRKRFIEKIISFFHPNLENTTLALWGLSFKPKTDDIRESAAIETLQELLKHNCKLRVYDPEAMENTKKLIQHENVVFCENMMEAAKGSHAVILATEWAEFKNPDFVLLKSLLKSPVIFDGRNQYHPEKMRSQSWQYFCIGKGS